MTKREITHTSPDPTALKALAHPERLRMLGLLRLEGPSTATKLAERIGLNSGATSYHLRQLEKHGFIETAPDMGNKRDRWWRSRHVSTRWENSEAEGDALETGLAMTRSVLTTHQMQIEAAHDQYRDLPPEWKKASTVSDYTMAMTAEAAMELTAKIDALLMEAMRNAPEPGTELPDNMRRFTILKNAFPHPGFPGDKKDVKK